MNSIFEFGDFRGRLVSPKVWTLEISMVILITQNVSLGNFHGHFALTKVLTLEISMVIFD